MKIKRFNENKSVNENSFKYIEKDDEIWISKKSLQIYFTRVLNGLKELKSENVNDTFLKNGLIMFTKAVKENVDDTGGNPLRILDPYGEEDWNE